jgi:type I restriction enzyme S subunit
LDKAEKIINNYRESLLQKAFKGLLVPQDPKDEPASELLKQIQIEKIHKDKSIKTKDEKDFKSIKEEEKPYKIPENWVWVRFGSIINAIGGSQPPKTVFSDVPQESYVRLIQIRDFKTDKFATYIPKDSTKKFFDHEDIMIGRYGPPIFQILRGLSGAYNVALMKVTPKINISNDFLFYLLKDTRLYNLVEAKSRRAAGQSGVNLDFLNTCLLPLPPLKEQERIVSKLEKHISEINIIQDRIKSQRGLIKKLRESILSKAFKGNLVEQIPQEGTGEELLAEILIMKESVR